MNVIYMVVSLVAKSCLTLWNPMDCSLPSSSVHGISQSGILKWVTVSFSRGSSLPKDQTGISWIGRWILYHWATREYMYIYGQGYMYIYLLLFKILFPYRPLQSIEYSSLCYTVGPYSLSILYIVVYMSTPIFQFMLLFPLLPATVTHW